MTAITWKRSGTAEEGVQPFQARHHLRQVAELISEVFADELDANGRGALQEMQIVSRLSPLLGGLLSTALFSEFVLGYVWVEDGQVVGNVTFQRADFSGTRWRISNVAVMPEHRRRGIANALMLAALREIAQRGGSWAVLQVRTDNPGARKLYENLSFSPVCQDGVWQWTPVQRDLAALPAPDPAVALQPLNIANWQERLDLARSARSPLSDWADPIPISAYQPRLTRMLGEALGNLSGLQPVRRWGAWENGRLMGAVETSAGGAGGAHSLRFDVRPEARGHLEDSLIYRGLADLARLSLRPILCEHTGDDEIGVSVLKRYSFAPQRILLTMRRLMTPGDAA